MHTDDVLELEGGWLASQIQKLLIESFLSFPASDDQNRGPGGLSFRYTEIAT